VLMEKKESKTGIEIMNLLQKEGRQRGTWNTKKADGDLYKMIVDAYEAQKQELVAENAELRALLRSMQVCSN
jgi:X breakpoint 2-interacting protein